ncbi:mechanosensitive ion channel family protein [Methylobacterium sp. CCH7-A2]|jgi:small-conductance mechanosensitive channel|uniref:mechanosensitive ion channel family protein n=1 Tax=Methylobacterium sp. CCH7-A2 TaxID=1768789 RepID=UPI000835E830|nr:mechanosensitive ion channel family protein [Methylobacterium sp. CCH7-A2]
MKPCVKASAVFAFIAALTGADAVLAQDSGAPPSTGLIIRLTALISAFWTTIGPIVVALPSVPAELIRVATAIAASPGFAIDLAKVGPACALIFLVAALPPRMSRPLPAGSSHDARLAEIMRRFAHDIVGALAACLLAVLFSELAFDPAVASGQLARAVLDFTLLFRLSLMVPAILFRPGESNLRLLRAHDRQIAQARPALVAALGVGIGFPALIPVWLGNGMDWMAGQALAVIMGMIAASLGFLAVRRFLSPVPGLWPRWRRFAGFGAIGFWLTWSYGVIALDFPFFFAVIRVGAVATLGLMAERFVVVALRTARVTGQGRVGRFWLQYGAPMRRVVFALSLAGIVVVVVGWAAETGPDWLGPGRLVMLSARIVEALAAFLIGYLLFEGVSAWLTARFVPPSRASQLLADEDEPTPASRLSTVVPVARGFLAALILGVSALVALATLGLDTTPLLAGAGIFGLAISFGSQSLVRDVVAGIFFLVDDAFRLGEYIETGKLKGSVERITLRSIQLRHQNGQVHTLPFGQLGSVTNFSRDWVTMKFNLRLARNVDIETVRKTVKRIGQELLVDPELGREFIQPLKLQGIADILENALVLRFKFTVRPAKPTVVQREALKRIVRVFAEKGIAFAANTVFVESREDDERLREAGAHVAAPTALSPSVS